MHIEFATCERRTALEFIQRVYPDSTIADEGHAKDMLDLVQADLIRIQDPMMYGSRIGIVPGSKWDESRRDEITAVCKKFHESIPI